MVQNFLTIVIILLHSHFRTSLYSIRKFLIFCIELLLKVVVNVVIRIRRRETKIFHSAYVLSSGTFDDNSINEFFQYIRILYHYFFENMEQLFKSSSVSLKAKVRFTPYIFYFRVQHKKLLC